MRINVLNGEPISTEIPPKYQDSILPCFTPSFHEIDQGCILSQSFSGDSLTTYFYDIELKQDLLVELSDIQESYGIFYMVKGRTGIQSSSFKSELLENVSVILDLCTIKLSLLKGRSRFWMTKPSLNYPEFLKGLLVSRKNKLALIDLPEQKIINDLGKHEYISNQEKLFLEVRLMYLLSRTLEETRTIDLFVDPSEYSKARIKMEAVKEYIHQNYYKPISLPKLLEQFKIGRGMLNTEFHKIHACRAMEYLHQIRINEAKKLLKESLDTVQEIAWSVGYSSHATFTRAFTTHLGYSPTTFRELMKSDPVEEQ